MIFKEGTGLGGGGERVWDGMFSGAGTGRPIEGTCALYPPDWNPLSSQPPLSPLTLHHQETQRSGPDWAQKALRTPGGSWPPRRSEALSLPTAGSAPSS